MDNCYTATARGLAAGVATVAGVIDLGETGRARRLVRVPIDGATVEGGRVVAAGATRRPALVAPAASDPAIVRVRTDAVYTRGCPGNLGKPLGAMGVVAEGLTAWGDAGGLGSHPDALLAMRPGSAIVATFAGGRHKGAGIRVLAFITGASAPVVVDPGDDSLVPAHPDLDVARLGNAGLDELIKLLEGDAGSPNTLRRLKERREKIAGGSERF